MSETPEAFARRMADQAREYVETWGPRVEATVQRFPYVTRKGGGELTAAERQHQRVAEVVKRIYGDPDETDTQRNERVYDALRNYVEHRKNTVYSNEALTIMLDLEAILAGDE